MNYFGVVVSAIILFGVIFMSSSDAKDTISNDGKTVSHDASKDPPFEWTLERMLMATPMPMTGEGRNFLNSHPNLDGIRTWSDAQFDKFLDSTFAKQHVSEEAIRWRDLNTMLEGQIRKGNHFLGKPDSLPPATPAAFDWKKLSFADILKLVDGKDRKLLFEQMKIWRKGISDMAPQVEALRKEAQEKGVSDKLEEYMSAE